MKKPKLFLLLLLALSMSYTSVSAQKSDSSEDVSFYLEGAVPEVDGKVVFSKEFSVPGLKKDVIYERVQKWMEQRMAENENDKSRLVYNDFESGTLAGVAEEWLVFKSNAISLDRTWMGYSLKAVCADEQCHFSIERIRYLYEGKEKSTAEEMITDKNVLNKAKTKMSNIGLRKWRIKTVDFANDMFDAVAKAISTDAATLAAEKAAADAATKAKKSKKVVINTSSNSVTAQESGDEVIKSVQPPLVEVKSEEVAQPVEAPAAQPAVAADELKEIAPDAVSKDAIKFGEGKLVIVVGEGDPFNMSITTANAGGSIGKVNNAPVVFSILSPDQSYDAVEKAETYNVKFYPTGATTPSLVLECKRVEGPAAFDGQPRTYIGEIQKAWSK